MLNKKNLKRCRKVFKKFGDAHQMVKMSEECAELIQAIARLSQGDTSKKTLDNFVEEFVDVAVVWEQLKYGFAITKKMLNKRAKKKLKKTLRREK